MLSTKTKSNMNVMPDMFTKARTMFIYSKSNNICLNRKFIKVILF